MKEDSFVKLHVIQNIWLGWKHPRKVLFLERVCAQEPGFFCSVCYRCDSDSSTHPHPLNIYLSAEQPIRCDKARSNCCTIRMNNKAAAAVTLDAATLIRMNLVRWQFYHDGTTFVALNRIHHTTTNNRALNEKQLVPKKHLFFSKPHRGGTNVILVQLALPSAINVSALLCVPLFSLFLVVSILPIFRQHVKTPAQKQSWYDLTINTVQTGKQRQTLH